jgi:hypothetical protein
MELLSNSPVILFRDPRAADLTLKALTESHHDPTKPFISLCHKHLAGLFLYPMMDLRWRKSTNDGKWNHGNGF